MKIDLDLDLRLRALVLQAYKDQGGVWARLAKDIDAVHRAAAPVTAAKPRRKPRAGSTDKPPAKNDDKQCVVDRRKLSRIARTSSARDSNVSLSITELAALQTYFVHKRMLRLTENLVFEHPESLLWGFNDATDVTVFLPTRHLPELGIDCASSWDMQAFEQLLRAQQLAETRVGLEDVFHFGAKASGADLREKVKSEPWYDMLHGRSVISVGSAYVNYFTERLLCSMCSVETPFERPRAGLKDPVPFRFYWPDRKKMSQSAFDIGRKELETQFAASLGDFDPDARGLIVGDDWYPTNKKNLSYDLIVAQRFRGQYRVVLSAIYAPASRGIAQLVAGGDVPISRSGTHHDTDVVHIAVARTEFRAQPGDEGIPRDRRRLLGTKLVGQPRAWDPNQREWVD